jgi:methionyl-tRNA formyltransferase
MAQKLFGSSTSAARVILISGHCFGAHALSGIVSSNEFKLNHLSVACVFALHPKRAASTVGYADLAHYAAQHKLPVKIFSSINSSSVYDALLAITHDYLLLIGLSQLAPPKVLALPSLHNHGTQLFGRSYGCVGMHPTLLPTGRGRAPIPWTILKGLTRSGVSTFFLDDHPDSGPIIDQEPYAIDPSETATSLFEKAARAHCVLARRLAPALATRSVSWRVQDDTAATIWNRRTVADSWIDFATAGCEIVSLVRALTTPYPKAFLVYKDHVAFVSSADKYSMRDLPRPGTIINIDEARLLHIAANDSVIRIKLLNESQVGHFVAGDFITTSSAEVIDDA